jgi:phosphoglycolate phosphatase
MDETRMSAAPSIRAIIFDFDGTLILSNEIKRDCYLAVANDWPNGEAIVKELLDGPPVGDRYALFSLFAQRIAETVKDKPVDTIKLELAEDYSRRVEAALLVCPERPGAMDLLGTLRGQGVDLYLNSGTPLIWLRRIVQGRRIEGHFRGLYGGPISKIDNLKQIFQEANLRPKDALIVGDGLDDEQYANAVGCNFLPVTGGPLAGRENAIVDYFDFQSRLDSIARGGQ